MKKRILIIAYDEEKNKDMKIETENFIIHMILGNKDYLTNYRYHYRYYCIYINSQLNIKPYEEWLNICIKPCLALNNEGIIFI